MIHNEGVWEDDPVAGLREEQRVGGWKEGEVRRSSSASRASAAGRRTPGQGRRQRGLRAQERRRRRQSMEGDK